MSRIALAVTVCLMLAGGAMADIVYLDTFENEDLVLSGNPADWAIFGAPLLDRGTLHDSEFHSPTAAVWVAVDWQGWGWGATTISNESLRYDLVADGATVSSWMRATNDFSAGSIAFTIFDADGTQLRTADADLFQLTSAWTSYESSLADMVVESVGATPGFDHANAVNFGFLSFTAGQTGGNQVQFDDFQVTSIPEPSTLAMMIGAIALFALRRIKHG